MQHEHISSLTKVTKPESKLFVGTDLEHAPPSGVKYMPDARRGDAKSMIAFRVVGMMLLKALLEDRPVPDVFPPVLYKFLLGEDMEKLTLDDLALYDRGQARGLEQLLGMSNVSILGFTFEEVEEGEGGGGGDEKKGSRGGGGGRAHETASAM